MLTRSHLLGLSLLVAIGGSPAFADITYSSTASGRNGTAFTNLVNRMKQIKPDIAEANVRVFYRGSGLGYAGDPNGMEMSPLVTVELTGIQFRPITTLMLATVTMPSFTTTLTAEDSVGSISN